MSGSDRTIALRVRNTREALIGSFKRVEFKRVEFNGRKPSVRARNACALPNQALVKVRGATSVNIQAICVLLTTSPHAIARQERWPVRHLRTVADAIEAARKLGQRLL